MLQLYFITTSLQTLRMLSCSLINDPELRRVPYVTDPYLRMKSPMKQIPVLRLLYRGAWAPWMSHPLPSYTSPVPPTQKLWSKTHGDDYVDQALASSKQQRAGSYYIAY